MRRAYGRTRSTEPRFIHAKFASKCACCGGAIPAGQLVEWSPSRREVRHLSNQFTGDSARCAEVLRAAMYPDPGELAADRWNEVTR